MSFLQNKELYSRILEKLERLIKLMLSIYNIVVYIVKKILYF